MKKMILASLMTLCLPALAMAQSAGDDLYFIPKKKKAEKKEVKVVVPQEEKTTTVYAAPGSTVVVKDTKGNVRDVDEYNRRYTSRENTFSVENDTLYIEEKPAYEQGEWINGFEGSQSDYEYAMRIVRFQNPRYAIPVSSPLYWDVVYGAYPSWDWNVYDDGRYAYVFPTYTNRLWWDWRFSSYYGPSWSFSWGWHSPWYYNSWYAPGYWGGYWGHHHHHYHPHYHHPHYYPYYSGGYWGGSHGWYGSSKRNPGIHAGRYTNNYGSTSSNRQNYVTNGSNGRYANGTSQNGRNSANAYRNSTRQTTTQGRVVSGESGSSQSVRPNRTAVRNQSTAGQGNTYTRTESRGSSYTRPSSTRTSVTNQRSDGAAQRNAYRKDNSSSSRSRSESSYSRSSSSSSSRSSYSSGSSSSSRGSVGGGGSRSGGGGRSGGGRTR